MPEYDFSGKVAFVTGAAHGQGESHAVNYAKHGADVVALDVCRDKETVHYDLGTSDELKDTAEQIESHGQEALTVEADVSSEDEVKAAVDEAIDHFGHVDVLANNAGIESMAAATKMDERMWDELIGVNLKGVWLCAKHVGKHFVDRGDGGKIVNTASISGMTGVPTENVHYVSAKHGVIGLTKTLALELAEYDVNVNAVAPGAIDTPMVTGMIEAYGEEALSGSEELGGPFNLFDPDEMLASQDITEAYLWLSSDAARYVTGITLPVDAGFTAK